MEKKQLCALVIISCIIMAVVDGIIMPPYFVKSIVKLLIFGSIPFIYSKIDKNFNFSFLKFSKQSIKTALIIGVIIYALIITGYFLIKNYIDLTNITTSLENNIGVNANNFIYVSIYISFINSFIEEYYFRGFSFIYLKKISSKKFAYLFSSICFSLYHIAMMINWMNIYLYALAIIALIIAGIFFNILDDKYDNIYMSWMVHAFANFAINTIGLILFRGI